jgi:hypothetical protein
MDGDRRGFDPHGVPRRGLQTGRRGHCSIGPLRPIVAGQASDDLRYLIDHDVGPIERRRLRQPPRFVEHGEHVACLVVGLRIFGRVRRCDRPRFSGMARADRIAVRMGVLTQMDVISREHDFREVIER